MRNVLEYLENTVKRLPDKVAFAGEGEEITFRQVWDRARALGSKLAEMGLRNRPVVVYRKRNPGTILAFLGILYGGCYYVPLDDEIPRNRVERILSGLEPGALICDETTEALARELYHGGEIFRLEDLTRGEIRRDLLEEIREKQIDTDPMYMVFTSGSTGNPKGVMACHRSVIDYIESLSGILQADENSVFGNQAPLYFDACLKEIFPTLKFGGTTWIIPKALFMFPVKLVEYLNEHRINTICWVVPALTMISGFGTLETVIPRYLRTVAFASEVFPMKQFHLWRSALSHTRFINLYGPTEATGVCCWYEVDREFREDETLPIGRPFPNTGILLLDENNREPEAGAEGEICIRGTCLTLGYYQDPEKTAAAFVQNPLNHLYPEIIYRTGDLGRYNSRGELEFCSRRDDQIKHMGRRIELGEIEVCIGNLKGVRSACCLFDREEKKILLFYEGELTVAELMAGARQELPKYMLPNVVRQVERIPLTPNGKRNRRLLLEQYRETERKKKNG